MCTELLESIINFLNLPIFVGVGTVTTNTINNSGTPTPSTANQGQNVTAHFSTICKLKRNYLALDFITLLLNL